MSNRIMCKIEDKCFHAKGLVKVNWMKFKKLELNEWSCMLKAFVNIWWRKSYLDILSKIVYGNMKDFMHHWEFIMDVFSFPCTKVVFRISEYKQTQDESIFHNMFNDLSSSWLARSISYIALQEDCFVKF
jgi:hypothetical protein